jgi:hypothetical protein
MRPRRGAMERGYAWREGDDEEGLDVFERSNYMINGFFSEYFRGGRLLSANSGLIYIFRTVRKVCFEMGLTSPQSIIAVPIFSPWGTQTADYDQPTYQ